MATAKKVREIWTALNLAFPYFAKERDNHEILQALHLYEQMLADIDGSALEAAALSHIAGSRFFPTIAELRMAAVKATQPRRELPLEAWSTVLAMEHEEWPGRYTYFTYTITDGSHTGESGGYHQENMMSEPTFVNPLTQQVVRMLGGWRKIMASDCPAAERARFIEAYQALADRERDDALALPESRGLRQLRAGTPASYHDDEGLDPWGTQPA